MSDNKIKLNQDSLKTGRKTVYHKVKDGHTSYRILPPFGAEANGYPYKKWVVLWGLVDPEKGRALPIASPSMVEGGKCPVVDYSKLLKEKIDAKTAALKASGASEKAIREEMKPLNEFYRNMNPKVIFAYNASDKAGTPGVLELKSTAHKKLKIRMAEYIQDYNQDPTSLGSDPEDSGVWFDFERSGEGFTDVKYEVTRQQVKVKGPTGITYTDDRSPLSNSALVSDYERQAYDLHKLYRKKTYQEVMDLLLWNIAQVADKLPDAVIEGFNDFSRFTDAADVAELSASPVVAGTSKVALKLDADEDDDETPVVHPSKAPPVKATAADEDVFAMADRLLDT